MKIYVFMMILGLLSNLNCQKNCQELISSYESEDLLIEALSNNLFNHNLLCIEFLLSRGLYKALTFFLQQLEKKEIKFREALNLAANKIKRKNEEINNKFRFDETEFQQVSPAFMWAQSLNNIYILIKFGHRHDSPGCLEVKGMEINVENNLIYFSGYCVQGEIPIKFKLNIDLFDEVESKQANWNLASVGRVTITVPKKKINKYWTSIIKKGFEVPNNMKFWYEMNKKFEEELQPYKDLEDEHLDNINNSKGTKKKKKGKKKSDL